MTAKEQDMKERYIYQVIRRIPKNQREEIRMELSGLIDDMCENDTIEHVLEKLGDPEKFARQYRDENSYLIGPKYYDNYIWVLKIVFICIAVSAVVSSLVGAIMMQEWAGKTISAVINGMTDTAVDIVEDTFSNFVIGMITAFGGVTLVFAIMERQNVKVDLKQEKTWKPEKLEPIPDKKTLISRSDSVVGIAFTVLFGGLMLFAPEVLGSYVFEDGEFIRTIPVFNLKEWNMILPFMMVGIGLCFVDEMIRLVTGCYCKVVMVSNIVTGILQLMLSIVILKVLPLWNVEFAKETAEAFNREFTSKGDLMTYWGTDVISNLILAIIFVLTFVEMGTTIYKTLRYAGKEKGVTD